MNRVYHILNIFASVLIKFILYRVKVMNICFIDSGIGGLSVFNDFMKRCNSCDKIENIYYFADFENSPYGKKSKQQLIDIMINNVKNLYERYKCTFFVLACNTATACTIGALRQTFKSFVFVGIEPAIKQALQSDGNILVMSTTATYHYSKLLQSYIGNKRIYYLPLSNLSSVIDKYYVDQEYLYTIMNKILRPYIDKNISSVVLGCTHYIYLKTSIVKTLGSVKFFDSSSGVSRRIINLINNEIK